ncbi:MAG: biotin/lipoyl-binding protein, partial [Deltaproteobacteria bacterium]|nr:biotin/lipoyl-binding protein [Deltaproteobacteria bacterium]
MQAAMPGKRALIWAIFAILVCAFLWSYFGKVEIVAEARGKVIPDGRVQVIQPMEEGIIKAIHVREGERVRKGQPLIDLDPTIKRADVESTAKSLHLQLADRERLYGELDQGSGVPGTAAGTVRRVNFSGALPARVASLQDRLRAAREAEFTARFEAQRLVIAQKQSALKA